MKAASASLGGDSGAREMTFTAIVSLLSAGRFCCILSLTLPAAHICLL